MEAKKEAEGKATLPRTVPPLKLKDDTDSRESVEKPVLATTSMPARLSPPKPVPDLKLNPSLFQLTEEEKEFALNVKQALEALPDMEPLSDFMCAHLAMMGDVEWAVAKAYQMQQVREEFDIRLSYEDGAKALADMLNLYPNVWMSYSFDLETGKSVTVMDAVKCPQSICRDPKNWAIMIKGGIYFMYASHPCFEVVRKGKTDIMECEGYAYGSGVCTVETMAQFTSLTVGTFPSHVFTKFYHTPVMGNIFVAMAKKLIPKEIAKYWEVGCQFAGGRLDKFYMLPTPEAATKRCLANLCHGLQIRMESEKTFSLKDCKIVRGDSDS